MTQRDTSRLAYELAVFALLVVFAIIVAIIAPASFLSEVKPLVKHATSVALILALVGIAMDLVRVVAAVRAKTRELELERQRLENERERIALETLKAFYAARDPVSDEELLRHKEEAQKEAREAKRLRDKCSPPRLSEAIEHFERAYHLDSALWKAGVAAAVLLINKNAFERARILLEEISASAEPGTEQRWAAQLNLGVLWNRKYLIHRSRQDAERALGAFKDAEVTLRSGKVERPDAKSLTLKNLAASNVALGRWKEAIVFLREYRGRNLSRRILEGTFDVEELDILLSMDPDLRDLFEMDNNEHEGEEGGVKQ